MFDEATARAAAIILAALGIPALLASLGRSIWKWWTGRAGRERLKNNDLVSRLHAAEGITDQEATERRQALEYAARLRRQLIEAGVEPISWPKDLDSFYHRQHDASSPKEGGKRGRPATPQEPAD